MFEQLQHLSDLTAFGMLAAYKEPPPERPSLHTVLAWVNLGGIAALVGFGYQIFHSADVERDSIRDRISVLEQRQVAVIAHNAEQDAALAKFDIDARQRGDQTRADVREVRELLIAHIRESAKH